MALPVLGVEIDFSNGASFGYPFLLDDPDYGILDTNILADSAADIVDITSMVMSASTRRGRNRILSNFEVGTATVTINDPNSYFNPQNTLSPYYGKLLPLRKIRIWADTTVGSTTYRIALFSGYINSFDTSFYQGVQQTSTVTLQCSDGFRLLNNVSTGTAPVAGCTAGQLSGARVNSLLDFAGFPSSLRSIDPGDSTMQVDPGGQRNILQAIQTVEQSEFGAFFISRSGEARFLDRTDVSELADASIRNYTDAVSGPTDLTYSNLDFAFDDQLILNDVTVTRYNNGIPTPAVPQTATDAASIATYFTKSGQRSDILVETDAESLDQANTLVAARKGSQIRIDSMGLNLAIGTEFEQLVNVSMDIYTLINITKTMSGGSTITRELFVQGVQHNVTPTTWNTTFLTAEPIIQAFILDSPEQGILGLTDPPNTNALSY
jgi:hypothetical protein